MNKSYKILSYLCAGLLASFILFTACDKSDEDPKSTAVELLSFGPSPALRGGELKIIGNNLEKVSSVILPANVSVSSFSTKTSELITLVIPEETVEGRIILKTAEGDVTSISMLTISEPIVLSSFSPQTIRPGEVLSIEGDYLNLIKSVSFSSNISVEATSFISQSKETIEVRVPENAQSGPIAILNGDEMPIIVRSEMDLTVSLPQVSQFSPNPVKAGTMLTLEGSDLDLVKEVKFSGSAAVSEFVSQSLEKIELMVPSDAHDGSISLVAASLVEVSTSEELVMVVPEITEVSPNPVKNGEALTITGKDLDLVTSVSFGGGHEGTILDGATETEMSIQVPMEAIEDLVTLTTAADKTVTTTTILNLVQPSISALNPSDAKFGDEITIEGDHLDLVTSVIFSGGEEAAVNSASENTATVTVPVGATSGPITIVTTNGSQVISEIDLTILVSVNAIITDMPDMAAPGDLISIAGEKLDEISEVIFPGEVSATMFGTKTANLIEVFIPMATALGKGNIKFITFTGEEFFSPTINIQGVEPVADPNLLFFNFDGLDLWWGDTGGIENDPTLSLDGSNYFRVNSSLSGWAGFFWRNGGNNFPGSTVGTDINSYVLKFDINVIDPITGGEFAWRLKGSDGDFWYSWKPWEASGSYTTGGWITVSIPLNAFSNGEGPIPDLNNITEDFGVAFNNGDSFVNACIDNVRFEKIQ